MICSKKILLFLALEDSEREKEVIEEVAVAGSSVIAWMEIRRKPKTFLIRKMHLNFSHQARPQLCWNVGFYSLCHKTIKPLHSVVFLLFLPGLLSHKCCFVFWHIKSETVCIDLRFWPQKDQRMIQLTVAISQLDNQELNKHLVLVN